MMPTARLVSLIVLTLGLGAAEVAYRETFPTGPGAAASGWHFHVGERAWPVPDQAGWGGGPGAGSAPAVNSRSADDATPWKGFAWLAGAERYLVWTDEAVIADDVESVAWHMALSDPATAARVALQIDADGDGRDDEDPWFVSGATFSTAEKASIDRSPEQRLAWEGAQWHAFDGRPGTPQGGRLPAAPGAAVALPAGPVVAFGLFVTGSTGTDTLDSVAIRAVGGERAAAPKPVVYPAPPNQSTAGELRAPQLVPLADDYQFADVVIGGGGYFVGVHPSRSEPGLLWARSDMCGPWKRGAGDRQWTLMTTAGTVAPQSGGASGLGLHPSDPDIAYADFGSGRFEMGLYRTTDGGLSWRRVLEKYSHANESGPRKWGNSVAVDPLAGDVVYWGTRKDGLWRSLDAGASWEQVVGDPADKEQIIRSVAVDPSRRHEDRSAVVYAARKGVGLLRSEDGGTSFARVEDLPGDPDTITWLDIADDGTLFASAGSVLLRFRPGEGWRDVTPADASGLQGLDVVHHDSARVAVVGKAPHPDKPGKTGSAIFRSTDGGDSWLPPLVFGSSNARATDHDRWFFGPTMAPCGVTLDPHVPGRAYSVDAFGIWRCEDVFAERTRWEPFMAGAENIVNLCFATPPAPAPAPLYSGVSDVRGFAHFDLFDVPRDIIQAPGEWITYVNGLDFCEAQPQVMMAAKFATDLRSNVLRSEDGGRAWRQVADPLPGKNHGGAKIALSATDPQRAVFLPGVDVGPRYTTDGGASWQVATLVGSADPAPEMAYHGYAYNFASNLCADRVDGDTFYAYRREGGALWVSRDGGASWAPSCDLPDANPYDDQAPVMVVARPGVAGEVWVTLGNQGLYRSTDFGQHFQRVPEFAGSRPLLLAFGASAPGSEEPTIFVHGKAVDGPEERAALYRSTDGGTTWARIPEAFYRGIWQRGFAADRQTYGRVFFGGIGNHLLQINAEPPRLAAPAALDATVGETLEVPIQVSDAETSPAGLTLRLRSSDPAILPRAAIAVDERDPARRVLRLTPRAAGSLTLELELLDGTYQGAKATSASVALHVD